MYFADENVGNWELAAYLWICSHRVYEYITEAEWESGQSTRKQASKDYSI